MGEDVSNGDCLGKRFPTSFIASRTQVPYSNDGVSHVVSDQQAEGETTEPDTRNHEESASQHRRPCAPLGGTMTVIYFETRLKDKINIFYHHENDPTLKQKKLAPKFVGGRALRWK